MVVKDKIMNKILFKIKIYFLIFILFSGCSTATKEEQVDVPSKSIEKVEEVTKPVEKIIYKEKIVYVEEKVKDSKIIVGKNEYIYIPSEKLKLKAKIDTGATTTSIHALNIKPFERDGKKWIKFDLVDADGKLINKALPISRTVYIKRHGAKNQKRYVVKMRINLATSSQLVDVTLTDRSKFTYPVLIGKNYLNGVILVDVSKKYMHEPTTKLNKE